MFMLRPQDTQRLPSFEELLQSLGQQALMNLQPANGPPPSLSYRIEKSTYEPRQPMEAQQAIHQHSQMFLSHSPQEDISLARPTCAEQPAKNAGYYLEDKGYVHSPSFYSSPISSTASLVIPEPLAVSAPCDVAPSAREDRETLCTGFNRNYACRTCGRSFTTSGHLARHNRIHTGERNHKCPFPSCNARFARQDNCAQHYRTHSNGKSRKVRRKKDNQRASV